MSTNLSDLFQATYVKGGRGENNTYDCFGLLAEISRRRGVAIPDHPTPNNTQERAEALLANAATDWTKLDGPEPWCAVALRVGRFVAHLGTVLEDGRHFIHISRKAGVVETSVTDPRWAERIAGYYRYG